MKVLKIFVLCAFATASARAQEAQSGGEAPSQVTYVDDVETGVSAASVSESSSKPEAPKPKDDEVRSMCPDGKGKQCALFAGRLYLGSTSLTHRDKTTWQALKNPYVAAIATAIVVSTVVDAEGTQACLKARTCREINPLFGSHPSRVRVYGVSTPINAFAIYSMARAKRNGNGVGVLVTGALVTVAHLYFGLSGFAAVSQRR